MLRLAIGALAVMTAAGCGRITLGGPEEYTPPPPGIDDLFRIDLLTALERALAGTEQVIAAHDPGTEEPALSATLTTLAAALPIQRTALLTAAQREKEDEAREDPAPGQTPSPVPADAPTDPAGLLETLVELRDLATDAARQVSGSLARPVVAIAAHTAWIAQRLADTGALGEVRPPTSAEQIVATREVPATDPPSIGAESDYHTSIEQTQQEEWYAAYLHEVLAARTEEEAREEHLGQVEVHRTRAEELALLAEQDGAPVVPRQAVYALPGGTLDAQLAGRLPTLLAQGLLIDHVALTGAAPFESRPLPIAAALEEAVRLAGMVDALAPLPSLEVEGPPARS